MSFRLTTIAFLALALALPGAAHASSISFSGDVLNYTAAAGETNNVSFVLGTAEFECGTRPAPCLDVLEAGGFPVSFPASRCADDGYGTVECDVPASIVAQLGDRDDSLFDWDGPSTIDGGPGNEVVLEGRGGADIIKGGPGNDALFGGEGDDRLEGGDGDDYFEGYGGLSPTDPNSTGGSDVYVGGGGTDFLDYAGRTEPLSISLDGIAGDGAAGEGDNVGADVEQVRGGNAADTITGGPGPNWLDGWDGDDTVRGGGGDDFIFGRGGNDRLWGEDGQDRIEGGDGDDAVDGGASVDVLYGDEQQVCIPSDCASGRDVIAARDGTDETVNCGPGTDTATLDAGDRVPEYGDDVCEQVERSAGAGGGGGGGGTGSAGNGTGAGAGVADLLAPRISGLRAGTLRRGRSLTLRYRLTEAASVTIRLQRRVRSRWVRVRGTISDAGEAGANAKRLTGRIAGRRLRRGTYRLVATARDSAGNRGPSVRATLRVR